MRGPFFSPADFTLSGSVRWRFCHLKRSIRVRDHSLQGWGGPFFVPRLESRAPDWSRNARNRGETVAAMRGMHPLGKSMSVQAAPETIHNELLKELASIYRGGQPNDIVLRALRNKADLLAKVDAGGALEVRGHVHLLKGELRAGQALFDRALNMSASRSRLFIRYLQGLEHSGHMQAVADVFVKHRDVLEGVADATRQAMIMLAAHGYLQLSGELRADLERMNVPIGEVTYTLASSRWCSPRGTP